MPIPDTDPVPYIMRSLLSMHAPTTVVALAIFVATLLAVLTRPRGLNEGVAALAGGALMVATGHRLPGPGPAALRSSGARDARACAPGGATRCGSRPATFAGPGLRRGQLPLVGRRRNAHRVIGTGTVGVHTRVKRCSVAGTRNMMSPPRVPPATMLPLEREVGKNISAAS